MQCDRAGNQRSILRDKLFKKDHAGIFFQCNAMFVFGDVQIMYLSSDAELLIVMTSTSYQLCPVRHKAHFCHD